MKKFIPLIALLVIAISVMPIYAEAPIKQVEIVNLPENPVPVTTDDQLDVNITNVSPIPVSIIDGSASKVPVSVYVQVQTNIADYNLMTVPDGKIFVLTDIIGSTDSSIGGVRFFFKEDTTTKLHITWLGWGGARYKKIDSINFRSGIPFSPESTVAISLVTIATPHLVNITITGYLLDI
jgi:hypothetical protein